MSLATSFRSECEWLTRVLSTALSLSQHTPGIHTELIFCLLGGRSISNALSSFGIADTSKALIVAIFDADSGRIADVVSHIQGTTVALSSLGLAPLPRDSLLMPNFLQRACIC
jgi:hypothetical protein